MGNIPMKLWLAPLISGLLVGIALNIEGFWFVALVALVPFLLVLPDYKSIIQVFFGGLLLGFALIGSVLVWFWHTMPLDWLGLTDPMAGYIVVFTHWFPYSLTLALPFAFLGVLVFYFRRDDWTDIPVFIAGWVIAEWFRAYAFAIVSSGQEGLWGANFTAGMLGYALSEHPLILQSASFGGVYFLSTVVVAVNVLIVFLNRSSISLFMFRRVPRSILIFSLVIILVATSWIPLPVSESNERTIRVAVANTYAPSTVLNIDEDVDLVYTENTRLAAEIEQKNEVVDVVVYPEDSRFSYELTRRGHTPLVGKLSSGGKVLLIDSFVLKTPRRGAESRAFYITDDGRVESHAKVYLAPVGEYTPYMTRFVLNLFGFEKVLADFESSRGYKKGEVVSPVAHDGKIVGTTFCSEVFAPSISRSMSFQGAQVLFNLSSQSWFHGSKVYFNQSKSVAKVRAVENRRYWVQASNGVPSFVLSSTGEVVTESSWGRVGTTSAERLGYGAGSVIFADVPLKDTDTLSMRIGDWPIAVALFVLVVAIVDIRRRGKVSVGEGSQSAGSFQK